MATAFVLIDTGLGECSGVQKALEEIPEVTEIHEVYGMYDLIVRVEAGTVEKLDTISGKIRGLNHVRSTSTMIVVE